MGNSWTPDMVEANNAMSYLYTGGSKSEYGAPIVRAPDGSAHSEQRQRKKRLMARHGLSGRQWVRLRKGMRYWPAMVVRALAAGDSVPVILRAIRAARE